MTSASLITCLTLLSGSSCIWWIACSHWLTSVTRSSLSSSSVSSLSWLILRRLHGYCLSHTSLTLSLSLWPSLTLSLSLWPSLTLTLTLSRSPSLSLTLILVISLSQWFFSFCYNSSVISVLSCYGLWFKGFCDGSSILTFFNLGISLFFYMGSSLVIFSLILTLIIIALFHEFIK